MAIIYVSLIIIHIIIRFEVNIFKLNRFYILDDRSINAGSFFIVSGPTSDLLRYGNFWHHYFGIDDIQYIRVTAFIGFSSCIKAYTI